MTTDATTPPATPPLAPDRLAVDECWELLLRSGLGRLATAADGKADIFPVNYLVWDKTILFRTAPGSKLEQVLSDRNVAFEVDGHDSQRYWSVVMHGTARVLDDDRVIIRSGVLELASWTPTEKRNFVQIIPSEVTGVHVDRAKFGRTSLFG
ncbi:MAG: pyridoxamine 5'-phosphate oxidase family protein [Pseudolysinimonas sp.]